MTIILQRFEVPIPRKISTGSSAHEKVLVLPLGVIIFIDIRTGINTLLLISIHLVLTTYTLRKSIVTSHCHCLPWMGAGRSSRLHHGGSKPDVQQAFARSPEQICQGARE